MAIIVLQKVCFVSSWIEKNCCWNRRTTYHAAPDKLTIPINPKRPEGGGDCKKSELWRSWQSHFVFFKSFHFSAWLHIFWQFNSYRWVKTFEHSSHSNLPFFLPSFSYELVKCRWVFETFCTREFSFESLHDKLNKKTVVPLPQYWILTILSSDLNFWLRALPYPVLQVVLMMILMKFVNHNDFNCSIFHDSKFLFTYLLLVIGLDFNKLFQISIQKKKNLHYNNYIYFASFLHELN